MKLHKNKKIIKVYFMNIPNGYKEKVRVGRKKLSKVWDYLLLKIDNPSAIYCTLCQRSFNSTITRMALHFTDSSGAKIAYCNGDPNKVKKAKDEIGKFKNLKPEKKIEGKKNENKRDKEDINENDEIQIQRPRKINKKVSEYDGLKEKILLLGFNVYDNSDNGDCFYNAVLDQLTICEIKFNSKKVKSVTDLRMIVATHLVNKKDDFLPFYKNDHDISTDVEFENLVKGIKNDRWGGQIEARIIGDACGICVDIYQNNLPVIHCWKQNLLTIHTIKRINIGFIFNPERHYVSLRRFE